MQLKALVPHIHQEILKGSIQVQSVILAVFHSMEIKSSLRELVELFSLLQKILLKKLITYLNKQKMILLIMFIMKWGLIID